MFRTYKFQIRNCLGGFSLVELLVVLAIMLLVTGGTIVFINRSNSAQKISAAKNELVGNLRMARNYARTLQVPSGYVGDMEYVVVDLAVGGQMTVYPMPGGSPSYSTVDMSAAGVGTSMYPSELFFAAYEGKLLKTSGENVVPRSPNETVTIIISSSEGVGETEIILINSVGLIDENRPDSGGGGGFD